MLTLPNSRKDGCLEIESGEEDVIPSPALLLLSSTEYAVEVEKN